MTDNSAGLKAPTADAAALPRIGAVVIGRNEGDRLVACLGSLPEGMKPVVYVDSGSTDGSVAAARAAGARVVALDMSLPFTAARARNAGFAALMQEAQPEFVQFLDGDCVLGPGWAAAAIDFLQENPGVAVVCGRRRERYPEASVYNRLCDAEWDTPVGQAKACGGDAVMRTGAVAAVGGFDESLIAGEEPELCLRLRREGWTIWRIGREMTLHDAAMTRFGQWWKRSRRAGHAFAEGAAMHGSAPEYHWVRETRRALAWGAVLPVVTLLGLVVTPWAGLLLMAYPLQVLRLSRQLGWERAFFTTLGKFPEALGALHYRLNRLFRRRAGLIEYK
ncbi:MAG: glycosyltransferase [Tabrizicola sp.]|nr:glycosyltransferase [Tabrizicola sp.]